MSNNRTGFITEFFGLRKEQKENQKRILKALSLIVGAIFMAEGIVSFFPESMEKGILISLGFILVLISILD